MGNEASWVAVIALAFLLLGGVWVGLALVAASVIALWWMGRDPLVVLAISFWGMGATWTITALPLFLWMGEILLRTRMAADLFRGLAPWLQYVPGRLLHVNVLSCTIFAAVSGSSAATCATIGRICVPELTKRGYPDSMVIGTLAGASTLGLLIPPSIIMIVYGVAADVSIGKLFIAGIVPGLMIALLFHGWVAWWGAINSNDIPCAEVEEKRDAIRTSLRILPVLALISMVVVSIYTGIATATEAAALGVLGSLLIAAAQGSLGWRGLLESINAAVRLYGMIALILFGSAYLTLAMGYLGLPRALAQWVSAQEFSPSGFLLAVALLYILLGCVLDGISMVVLTIALLLPALKALDIDLLWFGVFAVILVELAQITPPVGFNLFVLQGITRVRLGRIIRYAIPSFLILGLALMGITVFPRMVTWLPTTMVGP